MLAHAALPRPALSSTRAPPSARRPARQSGKQSVWVAVDSLVLSGFLFAPSRSAAAAAPAAARSLQEAQRRPSGGLGASSSAQRGGGGGGSQHGGGGGGGRGPGDGPRAGVRCGAALHQPLVHRRGRLRHGVVSVRARPQARLRLPTPRFGAAADATAAWAVPGPPAPPRPQPWASLRPASLGLRAGPWGRWRFGCCSGHFAGWPSLTVGRGRGGRRPDPGWCGLWRSGDFGARTPRKGMEAPPPLPR